jgi:hypothetical protein
VARASHLLCEAPELSRPAVVLAEPFTAPPAKTEAPPAEKAPAKASSAAASAAPQKRKWGFARVQFLGDSTRERIT